MLNFIKNFRNDEDGAVTVDWVVLTAAIVALGLLVGTTVRNAAIAKTATIVTDIQATAGS
ncbi:Flp family type IVb pilin [Loktanella salsilacus]|uniref:Flp family type IVb pilin n=1 Tax=Loktanella salsilacus TaxID=195913 RepID=UPI0037366874